MSKRKPVRDTDNPRVIGYLRVSTAEQADSRAGLDSQHDSIARELQSRGWAQVEWMTDAGISAKSLDRPALSAALEALTTGKADVLIVSKLDRLSRSLPDFVDLMSRAKAEGWRLVSLDCNVDTESPTGGLILSVLACFAEFERRLIGQRTKDGLAAKRAMGVRLGRPTVLPAALLDRITALSKSGLSYVAIAKTLTDEKVPTARGGTTWNPSSVRRVVLRVNEA